MRKSLWSPDEDEKLRRYVAMHGCGNWSEVAKHTGLQRCGKSCRLRWINYLRPDLKRGPFSADEVRLVINLHHNLGNSWSKIATYLPGRTDNDVKNFWHSYTRSRRMPQHSDHRSHNNMQASTELAKRPKKPASATTINKVGLAANYKGINIINISSGSQQTKCRIDENTSPASQQKNCDYPDNCEYNQLPLAQVAKNHRINPKHIMQFGHESLVSPLPECTELQAASINETPFTFPLSEACDINTLSYDEMAQVARSLINPLISLKPPLTSTFKPPILCNPSYSSASFDLEEKPPEGLQSVIWSFLNRQLAPASSDHTANEQVEPDHVLINHNINEAFAYANLQYSSPAQLADCFS